LNISYRISENNKFEYRTVIRTSRIANIATLANTWNDNKDVREFRISPTGD
jgi:hypothetical protein